MPDQPPPDQPRPDRPRYYLTTSIAYANNKPGLHTLFEVIGADAIARWHRMRGDDTRFLTGTDEYSVNIALTAAEQGKSTRAFVDEMLGFIRGGLEDFSVSREKAPWGIPFPIREDGSSSQLADGTWDPAAGTVYVWFDALTNYITGAGFPDDPEAFARWWPCDVHIIGKDINRLHTIMWPAMLMSAGLALPKLVWVHGWLLAQGERMSKSRGNFLDPNDMVAALGSDGTRYVTLREAAFDRDSDVSWNSFVRRYNADLANAFGNLVNRTVTMVNRYLGGNRPPPGPPASLRSDWLSTSLSYRGHLEGFLLHEALA